MPARRAPRRAGSVGPLEDDNLRRRAEAQRSRRALRLRRANERREVPRLGRAVPRSRTQARRCRHPRQSVEPQSRGRQNSDRESRSPSALLAPYSPDLNPIEQWFAKLEFAQVTLDGKPFILRQDLVKKPCPSAGPAQISVRAGGDQMAVQDGLDDVLQSRSLPDDLASTPCRHPRQNSHQQTRSIQGQPVEAPQLERGVFRLVRIRRWIWACPSVVRCVADGVVSIVVRGASSSSILVPRPSQTRTTA